MPSAEIQRHIIMAFLCMSTYARGTKLRFRWVNVKYQNDVRDNSQRMPYSLRSCPLLLISSVFEDNTQVVFDFPISLTLYQIDGAANKQALFAE